MRFKTLALPVCVLVLATLAGCEDGSISDQEPVGRPAYVGGGHVREIDELDLLGPSHGGSASEGDIQNALHGGQGGVRAWPGSSLLLVQSGAAAPDSIMLAAIEKSYRVFPFSGVTTGDQSHRDGALGRDLRLAAARSGCDHVLCYWGRLESIREDAVTKTVSWVPVVGGLVPDEERTTRLRVRAVLLDVRTGRATAFAPSAAQNSALSSTLSRAESHDKQIIDLKTHAYAGLVAQLTGQAL